MNYYLDKAGVHINNLKSDFDVSVLATLLEILTGHSYSPILKMSIANDNRCLIMWSI